MSFKHLRQGKKGRQKEHEMIQSQSETKKQLRFHDSAIHALSLNTFFLRPVSIFSFLMIAGASLFVDDFNKNH